MTSLRTKSWPLWPRKSSTAKRRRYVNLSLACLTDPEDDAISIEPSTFEQMHERKDHSSLPSLCPKTWLPENVSHGLSPRSAS